MEQIEITDEALPILKSGIALKEKLLAVKAESYLKRLKSYEKRHKMQSTEFLKRLRPENWVTMLSGSIGSLYMRLTIK
ncbi:MAG: hypothetical protein Q8O60_08720 [Deltaproteobacteria bacterium]|nr:hypothetical protein [Deltaproteobacteria bacterium]MDP3028772.1 hypothetical protein [Deltaproteobacteria bacterium]